MRKKPMEDRRETKLNKFLTTFDLTAMGVGATVGMGVYVLTGAVAKNVAGPAVIISFAIAAFCSMLAGFCYAEFGARVPKAGSAYLYTFVTIGEFVAFLIGWNLILEYAIGSASIAKGITGYINELTNNKLSHFWREILPLNVSFLGEYVDLFAFAIVMIVASKCKYSKQKQKLVEKCFYFSWTSLRRTRIHNRKQYL
jgi:solute carrier family 7 (cationic amino acid transporter), member 2